MHPKEILDVFRIILNMRCIRAFEYVAARTPRTRAYTAHPALVHTLVLTVQPYNP